jgi:hypothetical protein
MFNGYDIEVGGLPLTVVVEGERPVPVGTAGDRYHPQLHWHDL